MSRDAPPLKTYSHLAARRRMPSEYEIVTSDLLYYVQRGFAVDVPLAGFYQRYQAGSPLAVPDWERFADPRETTYTRYTELQARKETHVAALFAALESPEQAPPPAWVTLLEGTIGPWRFAVHGLQMIAAHVGQMAPSGRITIAALFQSADEMRRIQAHAYRMGQLRRAHPGFGAGSRAAWQEHPAWQPLRRLIETALVAFDWGEALTLLGLCAKPVLDTLFNTELARLAQARGDFAFAGVLASLDEDARWHREWTATLFTLAFAERAENRAAVQGWIDRWSAPVFAAAAAIAEGLWPAEAEGMLGRVSSAARTWLATLGLEGAGEGR
jgi:toluene monooxygenase system protein E